MKQAFLSMVAAMMIFSVAAQSQPTLSEKGSIHYNKAQNLIHQNKGADRTAVKVVRFNQAIKEFKAAKASDPTAVEIPIGIASSYRQIGMYTRDIQMLKKAMQVVNKLERQTPKTPEAAAERANIQREMDKITAPPETDITQNTATEFVEQEFQEGTYAPAGTDIAQNTATEFVEQVTQSEDYNVSEAHGKPTNKHRNTRDFSQQQNIQSTSLKVKLQGGISIPGLVSKDSRTPNEIRLGVTYGIGLGIEFRTLNCLGLEISGIYSPFRFSATLKNSLIDENDEFSPIILRYINLPIAANIYLGKRQRFYLSVGYQFGFLAGATIKNQDSPRPGSSYKYEDEEVHDIFDRTNGAILLGFHAKVTPKFSLGLEGTIGTRNILMHSLHGMNNIWTSKLYLQKELSGNFV